VNLFQLGDFVLNSGAKSRWKLECDALSEDDWKALAQMVRQVVGTFSSVEGVPRGGLRLASCLEHLRDLQGPHLIVDDVLTTGGSLEKAKTEFMERWTFSSGEYQGPQIIGGVVFARGQCPIWVRSVFQTPEVLWTKPRQR
jgi:orotate phosphoribosyltransferase